MLTSEFDERMMTRDQGQRVNCIGQLHTYHITLW